MPRGGQKGATFGRLPSAIATPKRAGREDSEGQISDWHARCNLRRDVGRPHRPTPHFQGGASDFLRACGRLAPDPHSHGRMLLPGPRPHFFCFVDRFPGTIRPLTPPEGSPGRFAISFQRGNRRTTLDAGGVCALICAVSGVGITRCGWFARRVSLIGLPHGSSARVSRDRGAFEPTDTALRWPLNEPSAGNTISTGGNRPVAVGCRWWMP